MFVRFVVGPDAEDACWLDGAFTVAGSLDEAGSLYGHESALLAEVFAWFNDHLPCPPFNWMRRSGAWSDDAVCWFHDDAGEPLRRMWDLVAILREYGVPVRFVRTSKPGKIVYRDAYQVVAETPRRPGRRFRVT